MATNFGNPSSPANDESDTDGPNESVDSNYQEEDEDKKPDANDLASSILKRLQCSVIKKPKQESHCFTCQVDYPSPQELEKHIIQHVSLPSVVLEKLPSEDEDTVPLDGEEDDWSDEEGTPLPATPTTPQKIDISQLLKKTGLSIKQPAEMKPNPSSAALNKLSGLGFTIKKNITPIKTEKPDTESKSDDVLKKLGNLGGLKLKLKSDGGNNNSFQVVNGLKDFKASDDEDEDIEDGQDDPDFDDDDEQEASGGEQDFDDGQGRKSRKSSGTDDSGWNPVGKKNIQPNMVPKSEQVKPSPVKISVKAKEPVKLPGRPAIKQTPKRGANLPLTARESQPSPLPPTQGKEISTTSTPERRESDASIESLVKKEVETGSTDSQSSSMPLFSGQIKSERLSPTPTDSKSTPIIAQVKTEPEVPNDSATSYTHSTAPSIPSSLLSVPKTEDTATTVIEINGDSNDEDDDCCVVSATPAPDVKPIIPKTEISVPAYSTYPNQTNFSSEVSSASSRLSKTDPQQHSFNWNASESKPPIDVLQNSADDIFDSLLSSATKKENMSTSDASEYISLDTLGPQHSCDVCNTRFTNMSLLDDHIKMTGHSKSILTPSSSLLPYNPIQSSSLLSSLLPVKQLAEQVGKLSTIGGSQSGFTHQQNLMINIHSYPGGGGVIGPSQGYNPYQTGQTAGYTQGDNMYSTPGQTMPGQYPGQCYMGTQGYGQQFQTPISQAGYTQNHYSTNSTPYSTPSPLQSMQQTVYGQSSAGLLNQQPQMGPPSSYPPISSPSKLQNSGGNIKIQNVQTFPSGQIGMPGVTGTQLHNQQNTTGHMLPPSRPGPTQIRMAAGANMGGPRPRMLTVRGARPSIRPGVQVHGQMRGGKITPRMPIKRPAGMGAGPGQKRRADMLLPGKHDNEDCHVMAMQKQRDGMPMIQSVKGAQEKLNLGSQISITKKTVNKEANAMANMLSSRGISVKQKQKSRSPSPERPLPHIPNLGSGVSIKHTSKTSSFSIPESKVGENMLSCRVCKKMFMNSNSLSVHMNNAHPQYKIPAFKCDECPASYPKSLQLQHHKRVFHNVSGANRELGIPLVDMSDEDNLKRLRNLGFYSFIPLANREQADGCFGIPVISTQYAQNGMSNSLQALGADGLLSLGPLKALPNS